LVQQASVAQFESNGVQHTTSFAIVQSYAHCGSEYVEINFSDPNKQPGSDNYR